MNRPVHFEMHVENPERAMAFYKAMFGWDFQKYGSPAFDYWLVTTGKDAPGINGGMMRRMTKGQPKADTPVIAFVCTVDVANIDNSMQAATKAGAKPALPKNAIPGVGWTAYFKDSEGNVFGLYQDDKNAK
jgi:predicted enzyme related to lactoylglutathione lyase